MRRLWPFLALLALFVLAAHSVQAADSAAGKSVYDRLCLPCHGPSGVGATGPPMNSVAFGQKFNTAARLRDITRRGVPGMPAYGVELLTDADLGNLVAYINSLVPPGYVTPGVEPVPAAAQPAPATPSSAQPPRQAAARRLLSLGQMYVLAVIALAGLSGLAMSVAWMVVSRKPS